MEKYPKDSKVMNAWNKITYDDNVEGGREGGRCVKLEEWLSEENNVEETMETRRSKRKE